MNGKPTVNLDNAQVVPRGDYAEIIKKIIEAGHCPFCEEYLMLHHPNPILHSNKHWLVTQNGWPYEGARLHFLLIARTHVERIEDLPAPDRAAFFECFDWISKAYSLSGASILWRSGNTNITGASVNHLHAQLIVGGEREPDSKIIRGMLGYMEK